MIVEMYTKDILIKLISEIICNNNDIHNLDWTIGNHSVNTNIFNARVSHESLFARSSDTKIMKYRRTVRFGKLCKVLKSYSSGAIAHSTFIGDKMTENDFFLFYCYCQVKNNSCFKCHI